MHVHAVHSSAATSARRVRSASSSKSRKQQRGAASSNEMTAAGSARMAKGKQRAVVQEQHTEDEEETAAAIPVVVSRSNAAAGPTSTPQSILVKGQSTQHSTKSDSDNDHEDSADLDAFDAASKRDDGLLAPLLKYLPSGRSMDIPGLRKLLGAVHPSAFGSFKSKEAWRRENPDVLYAAYAGRHAHHPGPQEGCLAHSPPQSINNNAIDDFDEELDWDKEDDDAFDSDDDRASVSSLAELGVQTPKEAATPPQQQQQLEAGPSKLAIYLSKPPEEQKRLARLSSPSGLSASASSSSSFSVSGAAAGSRLPPHSPTQLGVGPSKLRRQASNSSLATSSSVCTCTSNASRSSSISFAALPDTEDLRLHKKSRRGDRSTSMGIAGRRNLLLGVGGSNTSRSRSRSYEDIEDDEEEDPFARLDERDEVGDGDLDPDEDLERLKRQNESSLRFNDEGELIEKRPLGVTLEDVSVLLAIIFTSCRTDIAGRACPSPTARDGTQYCLSIAESPNETHKTLSWPSKKYNYRSLKRILWSFLPT